MPYFGGVTLAELFDRLRMIPSWRRTAGDWRDVLTRAQSESPIAAPASSKTLAAMPNNYPDIVCRIGICLADAAQYGARPGPLAPRYQAVERAHRGGWATDALGLSFGSRSIARGGLAPAWFGGTPGYMSPEQATAFPPPMRANRFRRRSMNGPTFIR